MEEKSSWKEKVKKFIMFASFGKYRTPLYYKGNDSYSSIITGSMSLIFVLGIIGIAIAIFVPIFNKDDYFIAIKSNLLSLDYILLT